MNTDANNCMTDQEVVQACVDICNEMIGCVAFFYQEHNNDVGCGGRGHQICAFYTDVAACDASNHERHGHRDGSLIMTKDTCPAPVLGCTDPTAYNYDSNANTNDGSCGVEGYTISLDYNFINKDLGYSQQVMNTDANNCMTDQEVVQACVDICN